MSQRNPVVAYLEFIVNSDQPLRLALEKNLQIAAETVPYWSGKAVDDLYVFFDEWLVAPLQPTESWSGFENGVIVNHSYVFWNFLDADSGLRVHNSLMGWMALFMNANQQFMFTRESAAHIPQWLATYPVYMQAFDIPADGYQSFRAFFLRHLRQGARPIEQPANTAVAVSPVDGKVTKTYQLYDQMLSVKDGQMNVLDLLNADPVAHQFAGGSAYTCNLNLFNYHRFHSPVSGRIKSIDQVGGMYYFDDNFAHLYSHRRAYIIFDTEQLGLVALVAVGQVMVNSISVSVAVNDNVTKGQALGHFDFGGSEVVLIFQSRYADLLATVKADATLQMGQAIATAVEQAHG